MNNQDVRIPAFLLMSFLSFTSYANMPITGEFGSSQFGGSTASAPGTHDISEGSYDPTDDNSTINSRQFYSSESSFNARPTIHAPHAISTPVSQSQGEPFEHIYTVTLDQPGFLDVTVADEIFILRSPAINLAGNVIGVQYGVDRDIADLEVVLANAAGTPIPANIISQAIPQSVFDTEPVIGTDPLNETSQFVQFLPTGDYKVIVTGLALGGSDNPPNGRYSFNAFVSPVPEAEVWAMMIAGIGLLGLRLKKLNATRGGNVGAKVT